MASGVLRAPAVHFLALGAALFGMAHVSGRGVADRVGRPRIEMTASDIERLRLEWKAEHGRGPSRAEEEALAARLVDEEILFREAVGRGVDRRQPIVRERLRALARYVRENPLEDEQALEQTARALGLERDDVVIRRHLVRTMRLALAARDQADLPTETELAAYYAARTERWRESTRTRLRHVFFSAARRGPRAWDDAARMLARLRRASEQEGVGAGDPFIGGAEIGPVDRPALERQLGRPFADAVEAAAPERWLGPVRSPYGVHLVWVEGRTPPRVPPLDEVRGQVVHELLAERGARRLQARLAVLRARYDIADPPWSLPAP